MTSLAPFAPDFRYLSDLTAPGCLAGSVLRSPHPHARILSIDVRPALSLPGVVAVITARDVPGRLRFGLRVPDQPILCDDKVRTVGDPVAAVAAETEAEARAACSAIRVCYEPLTVVASPEAALAPGAVAIHESGNLLHRTAYERGDLAATFATCAHVIADVYVTPHQVPAALELESALAVPDESGRIAVYAPGHYAEAERREIAAILGLPVEAVRVVASPAGGSFGGKDQLHAQPLAALLAKATGRPVRLRWSREDSFAYGVKRHPFRIWVRTGCSADGRLLTHEVDLLADTGAYAQHGPEVLETAHENVQGPYAFAAVRASGRLAYTNNGVAGAMRGFGALQVQVALEQQIDRLAAACGREPSSFRAKNLRPDDAPGQLGQTLVAPSYAGRALARLPPIPPLSREGRFIEATGIAVVEKGEGFAREGPNQAAVTLSVAPPGQVFVAMGLSELGQGLADVVRRLSQDMLGVAPDDICVVLADTGETPDSGPIAASRGVGVAWRTLTAAAPAFREAVIAAAARATGVDPVRLRLGPGGVYEKGSADAPLLTFADLAEDAIRVIAAVPGLATATGSGAVHAAFTACAAAATVRVDRLTGRIDVRHVHFAPVTGPVVSPAGVRAQCEGGAALAVGFLLTESLRVAEGRFDACNLDGYLLPTIADAPSVEVTCVDNLPADPLGPRGVGEIGVNAAGPAIANAILAATGLVCRCLPVDPEAVLDRLGIGP